MNSGENCSLWPLRTGEVGFLVGLPVLIATELFLFLDKVEAKSLLMDAVDEEARCEVFGRLAGGGS
jgi:hypothetical protein